MLIKNGKIYTMEKYSEIPMPGYSYERGNEKPGLSN